MLRMLCDFRASYFDGHPYYGNEKFINGQNIFCCVEVI